MRFFVLFFSSLWCCGSLFGQLQINPVFQHIGPEKLGVKEATAMAWDKKGGAWVVTNEGLINFNGYSSVKFPHVERDSSSPLSNLIQSFFFDSESQMWLAYRDVLGFSRMDPLTGKCRHFLPDTSGKNKNTIAAALIAGFREDLAHNFWIIHWGGGIAKFDRKKETFHYLPILKSRTFHTDSLPCGIVKAFTEVAPGKFLVGFFNEQDPLAQPCWFDAKTEKFSPFPVNDYLKNLSAIEAKRIRDALTIVHFIYADKGNKIWFGTYSCLIRFDIKNKTAKRVSGKKIEENKNNYENARVFLFDEKGYLWVGTPNAGIMVVDTSSEEAGYILSNPRAASALADNRINGLKKDPDGNIWVANGTGGYSIYTPLIQQFNIFPWSEMDLEYSNRSKQRIPVNQLFVTEENGIYISNEKGISVFNPDKGSVVQKIDPFGKMKENFDRANGSRIDNFKPLGNGDVFMISWQTPALYNVAKKTFQRLQIPGPPLKLNQSSYILFRHRKYEDQLYSFVNWREKSQIFRLDATTRKFLPFAEFTDFIPSEGYSYVLKNGTWLVSGSERSFMVFDPQTQQHHVYSPSQKGKYYFPDSTINTCYIDPDERIFFCTANGLYQYNIENGHCEYLSKKIGIDKEPVHAMIRDKYGAYWMTMEKEIVKWSPLENNLLLRFGEQEGLKASNFFGSVAQMDKKGRIYLVSINGITMFDPATIKVPATIPVPLLSSLVINDDTLNGKEVVTFLNGESALNWNQNLLTFEIKTTQLYAPRPHHFYYRLLGLDSAWIDNGNSNIIRFPGLSHGAYTLEVKVINAYRIRSDALSVPFEIEKPFWRTWWFYLLSALALLLFVYLLVRKRERTMLKRQKELENKIQERTAEVVAKAEEIKLQKDIIEEQNKAVLDSIRYAKRIQTALIASEKYIERALKKLNTDQ